MQSDWACVLVGLLGCNNDAFLCYPAFNIREDEFKYLFPCSELGAEIEAQPKVWSFDMERGVPGLHFENPDYLQLIQLVLGIRIFFRPDFQFEILIGVQRYVSVNAIIFLKNV
jgi:hypothetical protein